MNIPADLLAGDMCGFLGEQPVRWFTRGWAGHIAVYMGDGLFGTSLTKTGVGLYPLEKQGRLVWVRRPKGTFDLAEAQAQLKIITGITYGWNDCMGDFGLENNRNGMNCSHTSAVIMEAGKCPQFDPLFDKAFIAPSDFEKVFESVMIHKF